MDSGINSAKAATENDDSFLARFASYTHDHSVSSVARWSIKASRNRVVPPGSLRGRHLRFCIQEFRLRCSGRAGLGQFFFYFISRGAELFYRPAHSSCEFGQLLRPEQEQHDKQDYYHVRPDQIENTSNHWSHRVFELTRSCPLL